MVRVGEAAADEAPSVRIMLVNSDPGTFVALVLLVLLLLVVLRLKRARDRGKEGRRRLAMATGHPSTFIADAREDAAVVAADVADVLAGMGLVCARHGGRVWARGLAGEYVVTVIRRGVHVLYRTTMPVAGHELYLGYFGDVEAGLWEIARHGELPAPA